MKKLLKTIFFCFASLSATAQYFSTEYDTVRCSVAATANVYNLITNITTTDVQITWKVSAHDFPADWSDLAICDNALCRTNANNQLLSGTIFTSNDYEPAQQGDFHLQLNLTAASAGTHYIIVTLKHSAQLKDIVFVISHWPTTVSPAPARSFVLYPNPAAGSLQITGLVGLKKILIVNALGQIIKEENITDDLLQMDIADLSPGQYFIKYFDEHTFVAVQPFMHY